MNWILIGLFFYSHSLWAQSLVSDLEKINQDMGQTQVDEYLKSPSKDGVPGSVLTTLLPTKDIDPKNVCSDDEEKESKNIRYEVILVAEANSQKTSSEEKTTPDFQFSDVALQNFGRMNPANSELSESSLLSRAGEAWERGYSMDSFGGYDPHSDRGRELYIESLILAANSSSLSENELSKQMAQVIGATYKSDEERYTVLSSLSMRLYRNYNDARNPGQNNSKYNPDGNPLPQGDMSIQDLFSAAVNFDKTSGGVCNDISETVAMVGEHLFPNKDVLVINSGSHFGVAVVDGKGSRIIDGASAYQVENQLFLNPAMSPTNLRINKVENGALKEIAVVDTQMGQLTEAAFQTGKKLLKTDADISSLMAHYKKKNFGVTVGSGNLSDSKVLVVVAKYETVSDKWKKYVGVGATGQDFSSDLENKYQVHFRAGVERNMFRYVNAKTSVNFSTGLRLNGMYALGQDSEGNTPLDFSGGVDLYNRLDFSYGKHKPDGVQLRSSVEVEHAGGAKNWGNVTGAMSSNFNVGKGFKNMTFHLNQINANVTAEKKITPKLTSFTSASYQGSNVGQSVSILSGLDIKAPEGAQILVFTGYTNSDIKGFETQNSLLATPSGLQIGGSYKTKKGIEVGGAVRGISGTPSVNGTLKINLNKKRR